MVLAVALGFVLVVAGFGSTAVAHQSNQECHERWDDVPDAHADCEDFLYVVLFYGGVLVGAFGLVLLGAAGREHVGPGRGPTGTGRQENH